MSHKDLTALAPPSIMVRKGLAIVAAAALVAASAQVAFPIPGTPVPSTLQPMAVVLVGLLLSPMMALTALVSYLVAGALGAPVFAAGGVLGIARLIGPTGGYLIAFPVAAFVTSKLSNGEAGRLMLAALAGMVIIHLGGLLQLTLLTGSGRMALIYGMTPFAIADLVKAIAAGLIAARLRDPIRRVI